MGANKEATQPRTSPLSAAERTELRKRLESERRRLQALYRDDVRRERAVEFGEAEDLIDRSEKGELREEESALADLEREQLRLVEEALERMAGGSYGFCLRTGDPIPLARLRAVPWARFRREVQEEFEEGEMVETSPPPAG